jgi:CheY-like chemotaxis protein
MSSMGRGRSVRTRSIYADPINRGRKSRSRSTVRRGVSLARVGGFAGVSLVLVLTAREAAAQAGASGGIEGALLNSPVMVEVVKIIPSVFWLVLAFVVISIFYKPIRNQLLPLVSGLKVGGIECSFVREAIEASVALAKKQPRWQVQVSDDEARIVMNRAARNLESLQNAKILWVDDFPENNFNEIKMLHQLRTDVETSKSTDDALERMAKQNYTLVLSDLKRNGDATAGLKMLERLKIAHPELPVIFYVGEYQAEKGVPPFAFGLTNRPDELLHLVLDVVERRNR